MEYKGIVNYKGSKQMYLYFIYLMWAKITTYDVITLTTLQKDLNLL